MSLVVDNIALAFDKPIFEQVSFCLDDGEIACLLGASGCGKTSILRCILGFNTPHTGDILLDNVSQSSVPPHKRGIGMVFQDYALFPHLTVADNIAFGLNDKTKSGRVKELLALIKLNEFAHRYPHELSGGQQQRVALARAIAPMPKFVLLDEPFSNLDVELRQSLCDEVRLLLKSQNIGAILVTHDQNEAFAMADKIGVMADGKLCSWGTPMQLYHTPNDKLTAGFIGEGAILPILSTHQVSVDNGATDKAVIDKVGVDNRAAVAMTAFGAVACDNLDNTKTHLLVRPRAVVLKAPSVDNSDKSNATLATIVAKKFHEGRWLYGAKSAKQADGQVHLIKAYADHDWQIGDSVSLQITQAWAVA